ncbi:MAG: ribosome maturation factor RimP [Alphaproteobacteria bacterium]
MTSGVESDIARLVAPALDAMGFAVVRIKMMGKARPTLQVMAERQDGTAITVDDCAEISRVVSALLDVDDPIAGAYDLEVSSPGIDRPLVRPVDFERFAGHVAKIETRHPIGGRRRFRGRLLGVSGDEVCIAVNGDRAQIPLEDISAAKLVLTDELIAATDKQRHV